MAVESDEMAYYESVVKADIATNGGRIGTSLVSSGVRHALFPRVTKAQRTAGLTRYRKQGLTNINASEDIAYGVLQWLEFPSLAGDRFYIAEATDDDVQSALTALGYVWTGCGALETALVGGESSVNLTMENDDFQFPNGGYLHISNNFLTSQTIAAGVREGDSVTLVTGTWQFAAQTDNITHPAGIYVGGNKVLTAHGSATEEWLELATNLTTAEDIGDGDGADTNPPLTTLANNTNGICTQPGKLPVVTATCGAVARTVNVANDGSCSGYCSAGTLNMETGVWTVDIEWTTAPDNVTDITCTYYENCYIYVGNVVTLTLNDTVVGAYLTTDSYGSGCTYHAEVTPTFDGWTETSVAGTYDESGSPLTLYNLGTVEDSITVTMTGATTFTVSGVNEGDLGTGAIGGDFEPVNPDTSVEYFSLLTAGWGGTWAIGETIEFDIHKATAPIWVKNVIPALTAQEPNNVYIGRWYNE